MLPEDVVKLDAKIKEMGFVIFAEEMPNSKPIIINSLLDNTFGNRKYITFQNLTLFLKIEELENNRFWINETFSPVIEFYNAFYSDEKKLMRPGRLYYNIDYFDKTTKIKTLKSNFFIKNAENLFKWCKTNLNKTGSKNIIISNLAQQLSDLKGYKLLEN